MHSSNWDDLRFVVTVAETGSISAAARDMGVNHATVLRRVAAFEASHGGAVFERSAKGYRILPDRLPVIEAAREVGHAISHVARLMEDVQARPGGVVRVASTDTFCLKVLPPLVARLASENSPLRLDFLASNQHLDFTQLQADITVRPTLSLPDALAGVSPCALRLCAVRRPDAPDRWIGPAGPLARSAPGRWQAKAIAPETIVAAADSFLVLHALVRAGVGQAFMPAFLVAPGAGFEPVPDVPVFDVPIWVASHIDLQDVPRLRAVRGLIADFLSECSAELEGRHLR